MSEPDFPDNVAELPYNQDSDIARIKMQPHSLEAEQSVIGGLLLAAEGWDSVAEEVAASDFYKPAHRDIFREIAVLADAAEQDSWAGSVKLMETAY